ncbi:radical SAM protein [Blastochloris viridis]|uniref:FeMo cofactor biosynthesis protein NifB n=2 Tax=Blastochloris viridis TaxID=1079 RepID=A0A0N7IUH3_BLAVI|nr:radical SAM protein [Blastochloris viridis]ALK09358.1 FeMo cofactor biosynthesis protein NifB [Blastochloris viridis]CUU42021.1 Molybdenum cofactor biosynthesis protein A [Blastochloris viridis]
MTSSSPPSTMCPAQAMRPASATPAFPALEGRHPCFSTTAEGHARSARLHLPVSPGCNIACAFCKRDFNRRDQRPGVATRLLTPDEATDIVARALELCSTLAVVGIAGPGDPLASTHALDTFALVRRRWPHLILCLSTNGLMLPAHLDAIADVGVATLTVTVNAVDPAIQAQITPKIAWQRRRLNGIEAAERLIANQLEGIKGAAERGLTVKVNTVLIPGVNDHHIGDVAAQVAAAGARLINVIALIPQHDFAHLPAPGMVMRHRARTDAAQHLKVFTHCQRCRADACGIPGVSDYTEQLYGDRLVAEPTFSHG